MHLGNKNRRLYRHHDFVKTSPTIHFLCVKALEKWIVGDVMFPYGVVMCPKRLQENKEKTLTWVPPAVER